MTEAMIKAINSKTEFLNEFVQEDPNGDSSDMLCNSNIIRKLIDVSLLYCSKQGTIPTFHEQSMPFHFSWNDRYSISDDDDIVQNAVENALMHYGWNIEESLCYRFADDVSPATELLPKWIFPHLITALSEYGMLESNDDVDSDDNNEDNDFLYTDDDIDLCMEEVVIRTISNPKVSNLLNHSAILNPNDSADYMSLIDKIFSLYEYPQLLSNMVNSNNNYYFVLGFCDHYDAYGNTYEFISFEKYYNPLIINILKDIDDKSNYLINKYNINVLDNLKDESIQAI